MTNSDGIDKVYVRRYVRQAQAADNELVRNDALYRVGTHMEVIECNGDTNLCLEHQERILQAADELLGGDA